MKIEKNDTAILINDELTDGDIITIRNSFDENSEINTISFTAKQTDEIWTILNEKIFVDKRTIRLSLYSGNGEWKNLDFLKNLSNVKDFYINESFLESIEPINFLEYLTDLHICSVDKPNTISFRNIRIFNLKKLVIGADFEGVESSISKFVNLTELTLESVKLNTLECLLPLKKLRKLVLSGKGILDYSLLGKIGKIATLYIRENDNINNIEFISEIISLKELRLLWCAKIEKLPSFEKLTNLIKIDIFGLKRLHDITSIMTAKNLEEFKINQTKLLRPIDFEIFSCLVSMKHLSVGFGGKELDNEFEQLLCKLKLTKY